MKVVFGYNLAALEGAQEVMLPFDARILHVSDHGGLTLWALVRSIALTMPDQKRTVYVVPTGVPLEPEPERVRYLNTFETGGRLFHAFEILL